MALRTNISRSGRLASLFRKIKAAGHDTKPLMETIGRSLKNLVALGFRDEKNPYGHPWHPLSGLTQEMRRKGEGSGDDRILDDTGRLRSSIAFAADSQEIALGTTYDERIVRTHLFGAVITPKSGKSLTIGRVNSKGKFSVYAMLKRVVVPARPFLPVGPNFPESYKKKSIYAMHKWIEKNFLQAST